jgi:tetratricopeptide (TPR) repeat protein
MIITSDIIKRPRHPWLDRLAAEPERAVDTLLRGIAHLPSLQRASPSEALMALLGDLPKDALEWKFLDQALLKWLKARRNADDGLLLRPGGTERFVRETGEAFRAAWRLGLSESCAWIHSEVFDLLRWANGYCIDATFDLGRAVLNAAAYVQQDSEFRFLWLRICEEAAVPRLRHRLDAALLGLAKTPNGMKGGPSHHLIVGLARWAAQLPKDDHFKSEVVREWRSLKAAFPRQPSFWRDQWEAILSDERIGAHPFTNWLRESDPALQGNTAKGPRRLPVLPKDISGTIRQMQRDCGEHGLTAKLWSEMETLLTQVERYADATGESYYFVTSCVRVAGIVMSQAPGQSLALTRRALLWSPSDGHAWSVRAKALNRIGRSDLSEAVLWEAIRRTPSDLILHVDLALTLTKRGEYAEAEALLRKAANLDLKRENRPTFVELARVMWLRGNSGEALELMRDLLGNGEDAVDLYFYGCLLIAEGRHSEAEGVLTQYVRAFGNNHWTKHLERDIGAGEIGQENMRNHLREQRQGGDHVTSLPFEIAGVERVLAMEQAEFPRLEKIGRVARADLLFQLGDEHREDAIQLVNIALTDPTDAYAQVVKGLALPAYRNEMMGRTGRFVGSLPVRLALAPENVSVDYWRDLVNKFPEGQHLIRLVQLTRGQGDELALAALTAWCREPSRWDNGWDRYLKDRVHSYLDSEEIPINLATLVHDALTQAVDVGMDALPVAA